MSLIRDERQWSEVTRVWRIFLQLTWLAGIEYDHTLHVARPEGLEPPTVGSEVRCSIRAELQGRATLEQSGSDRTKTDRMGPAKYLGELEQKPVKVAP